MTNTELPSLLYLWPQRTVYIGPLFEPVSMANGSASLAIALNGSMMVSTPDATKPVVCRSFLVPPGIPFTADTGDGIVANCMLDALGFDYAALYKEMMVPGKDSKRNISYAIKNEDLYREGYAELHRQQLSSGEAYQRINQMLTPPERLSRLQHKVDPRVEKVIALIKQNIDQNMSIKTLAEAVNVSVPRLVQIFKNQTGVPIRRYRNWHRLYVTSSLMASTGSLTQACLKAGFADGVHFAHTFQKILGMRASLLLSQPNQIRIVTEDGVSDGKALGGFTGNRCFAKAN